MSNLSKNTEDKSMIFLHVPKAAGTTLHQIIERQYKSNAIFSLNVETNEEFINEFTKLSESQRKNIRVLKGHMNFGLHKFLPQPFPYITMVRDPVERIISHYYYILRNPTHYLYNEVTSRNMSLKDYVCSEISIELDNDQTRLLAGRHKTDVGFGKCSSNVLETAKKNIEEHFAVVGISEKFDETLILLKKLFGWKLPFYIKANVTTNRLLKKEIAEDTLKVIEKHNELDIELYTYAKKRLEQLIIQQGPSFERELELFKLLNKPYGKVFSFSHPVMHNIKSFAKTYI